VIADDGLTFAQTLELLSFADGDNISLCWQGDKDSPFCWQVCESVDAAVQMFGYQMDRGGQSLNFWFTRNPLCDVRTGAGWDGFVAVEQVPLHAGEHAVLQPLVGAGGVGADPTGGEGDGGDDHGPPQVDLQDLAVSAVAHAYPGLGGVGAGHCLGGTGSGRAAWR